MSPEITVDRKTIEVTDEVASIVAGAIERAADHNYPGKYVTPEITKRRNDIGKQLQEVAELIRTH